MKFETVTALKNLETLALAPSGNLMWGPIFAGKTFGEYQIQECVSAGQFGLVLEAVHLTTGKSVALKVLPPNGNAEASVEFQREGDLLDRMSGASNVVELYKIDKLSVPVVVAGGQEIIIEMPCLVMELADGCLEELILYRENLDWNERLRLWRGVVRGVHQMHLRQIVHRDLKSSNCLVFVRPKNRTECKVTDLGRSRHLPSHSLSTLESYLAGRGDFRFAPPEFLAWQGNDSKESHVCSDLYGLGSILFELATGQGITAFALGAGPQIVRENLVLVHRGQSIDLSGMRAAFEPAHKLFESSVPSAIRSNMALLLRQLCDPEPLARLPKLKFSKRTAEPGLDWLLVRADILARSLSANSKGRSIVNRRGV